MSQQHAYLVPYVYRADGLDLRGYTLLSKVHIKGPFSVGTGPAPTIQQNVNAANHWYQNCMYGTAGGGWFWYVEEFKNRGNLPSGLPNFPLDGQLTSNTTPPGSIPGTNDLTPAIPTSIRLQDGGYWVYLVTEDNGKDTIRQHSQILNENLNLLWSSPEFVSAWSTQTDGTSGEWYDPLTVFALDIATQGGQASVFQGGPFEVQFVAYKDADPGASIPLAFGGQWNDQDGIPHFDPVPRLNTGSGEVSNIRFTPEVDPGAAADVLDRSLILSLNGFTGRITLNTDSTMQWRLQGATPGARVELGFVKRGVNPAPQGAGYFVVQDATADPQGNGGGSIALQDGIPSITLGDVRLLHPHEGQSLDAYAYDCALQSGAGYSQAVQVDESDALTFHGVPT